MKKGTLASLIGIALAGSASAQQDATSEADAMQAPSKTSQQNAQQQANQDVQRPNSMQEQAGEVESRAESDYQRANEHAPVSPEYDPRKGTQQSQSQQSDSDYQSRARDQYQDNQEPAPANSMPRSNDNSERMSQSQQTGDEPGNPMNDPIIENPDNTTMERQSDSMADAANQSANDAMNDSGMKNARGLSAMNPDDLEGKAIFNTNGDEVGDVDSIKVEKATKERVAIVGIQGIIGDEMKEVAIPLSQLNVRSNGDGLETSMTKDQLEQRPDVDPLDDEYVDVDEYEEAE